jgi:uncharacterized membrane protein YcaP (DUF421 family)
MSPDTMFNILLTTAITCGAYFATVIVLRLAGKRVLSKWNAFDFVVTVAFGSILATTILSSQTDLVKGIAAFTVLAFLQVAITFLSVRSRVFEKLVKASPKAVLYKGKFQQAAMEKERVTEGEVRAAVRAKGMAALEDVYTVILETDGSFSVIQNIIENRTSALSDIDIEQ